MDRSADAANSCGDIAQLAQEAEEMAHLNIRVGLRIILDTIQEITVMGRPMPGLLSSRSSLRGPNNSHPFPLPRMSIPFVP